MPNEEYVQEKWSLDELFPALDSKEIEDAIKALEAQVASFEELRDRLSAEMGSEALVEALDQYDQMARAISRLMAFSTLKFTEDTQDQAAQTFQARMYQLGAELDNRTMFFKLWWKGLEDDEAKTLMDATGDYQYWLEALRLQKPYTLSEPEEKVINIKDVNGSAAMVTLYESITNRYKFPIEVDGGLKELTYGEMMVYAKDPDPDLRAAAYRSILAVYGRDVPILGQIYQYRVRDWSSENVRLRDYSSPIAVRNLRNDLPDDLVDMMLEICKENATIYQRYFRLKAKWVGMEKLRRFDVYAPVVKTEKTYSFAESAEVVLQSFDKFEPKVATLARKVLDEHHIDSEVREGKRSGAFCLTVEPDLTPWVQQNFQGRPDDLATMAHELGHAIHSLLAADHTALTQSSSLPLAETASTFSEMLLIDELLERDPDPEVQRDLLFRQMDDSFATIQRQAFFGMFEKTAFELIEGGASIDDLTAAYWENLETQFGDSLELNEEFKVEWSIIPHFHTAPFYVYAYAFGQLLVLALYKQYREEGDSFKPRYLEILAAGGSDSPVRILDRAGIDVASPDFWNGGFQVVEEALQQLEAIPVEA
ncbi:MAG: M3 family oligoendopeptidase [Anaerolineales bacterium]